MNKKKARIFSAVGIVLMFFVFFLVKKENKVVMKMFLINTGDHNKNEYYIVLYEDGTLICTEGEIDDAQYPRIKVHKKYGEYTKILTEEEILMIEKDLNLIFDQVFEDSELKMVFSGSHWKIYIEYNDIIYQQYLDFEGEQDTAKLWALVYDVMDCLKFDINKIITY